MKIILTYFFFCSLIIGYGCQKGSGTNSVKSEPAVLAKKMAFPFNTPKVTDPESIHLLREYTKELILKRQKHIKESLFDLTYYYLNPRGFANSGTRKGPSSFVGLWIKFDKDYTYQYGRYEEIVGDGIYHYAESDKHIFMLDNDSQIEPKLFDLLSNSEFFNFLGHPIIVVKGDQGQGQILLSNFANDKMLEALEIIVESPNGMQIMMNLDEQKPLK